MLWPLLTAYCVAGGVSIAANLPAGPAGSPLPQNGHVNVAAMAREAYSRVIGECVTSVGATGVSSAA